MQARSQGLNTLMWPTQGQVECQGRMISTLLLKARDKDRRVQLNAYEMLAETGIADLHASLGPCQWRDLIDAGLGLRGTSQQPPGGS